MHLDFRSASVLLSLLLQEIKQRARGGAANVRRKHARGGAANVRRKHRHPPLLVVLVASMIACAQHTTGRMLGPVSALT